MVHGNLWFMIHGSRLMINDLLDGREEVIF